MRVTLTHDDAGQVRQVRLGDELTVVLPENPTTGYRWHAEIDTERLRLVADDYDGPERPVGAGGMRRLTFAPLRPGRARLRLVNRRSWEESGVDEYDVVLEVAED